MEQKNRILIVEDDTDINNLLYTALQKAGYETVQAFSGTEARMLFQMDKAGFSLILLDLMLPGISGEEVLAQIRKQGNTPVIVLTAKDGLDEKIGLLTSGADDYITKPFSMPILLRKIAAILRRSNQGTINSPHTIQYQNLVLSLDGYTVKVDEKSFMLTQKEFELLRELLTHQGQVLTRQSLLNKIWKYDFYGDERVVDTHIKNLRKKLDINFIQTVRGVGYKID